MNAALGYMDLLLESLPQIQQRRFVEDNNVHSFTYLLAGGGVKRGLINGSTDDFRFEAVENPVHIHDLHATALHLLGLAHERLTYRYSGTNLRLTDVEGRVIKEIFAGA